MNYPHSVSRLPYPSIKKICVWICESDQLNDYMLNNVGKMGSFSKSSAESAFLALRTLTRLQGGDCGEQRFGKGRVVIGLACMPLSQIKLNLVDGKR